MLARSVCRRADDDKLNASACSLKNYCQKWGSAQATTSKGLQVRCRSSQCWRLNRLLTPAVCAKTQQDSNLFLDTLFPRWSWYQHAVFRYLQVKMCIAHFNFLAVFQYHIYVGSLKVHVLKTAGNAINTKSELNCSYGCKTALYES